MNVSTPRLAPLDVPWKISPSAPALSLATEYVDGDNFGVVRFIGFLGQETKLAEQHGNYVSVIVLLERLVFATFYPEFSNEDKERLDNYDWSDVPEFRDTAGSLKGSVDRFHAQWNDTGICPEPAAYRIVESDRIARLGLQDDHFKHFLFVGDDFNVEAIAQNMKWELGDLRASAP